MAGIATSADAMTDAELLHRRKQAMGPAYRLFYQKPVHLVRGEGVWLYDSDGKRYLDCYNNVASVGHCHPHVVEALSRQASTLNTHTRYLHDNVVRYAERLADTLPGDLSVCMFVCTGTEANDLAFRIARTVTGNEGAIVTENAYHGNSMVVTELSSGEYPASERPDYLEAVEPPNPYRGAYRYGELALGAKYAGLVGGAIETLSRRGHKPAMFLCDSIFDSNGALTAPAGYFHKTYEQVREAGGLCVADEVQSGLCRLGDHMWGFEDSGVIPDIVTMGKPIGDGHPLAAVVTTPVIAEEFSRKFQYFNTFGGNPVSTAVGLAVLDVVEQENILQNVQATGAFLGGRLKALAEKHELIGDVRGKGLFYGLEIVRDRCTLEPGEVQAQQIREFLRDNGVLLSTTGPLNNVVKIRPPMVFSKSNAELLLDKLEQALNLAEHG
jgi:4-aminobutyrate aminotransferase-like enzyme